MGTAVFKMKSVLALTFLPLLASSLKILPQSRETYASYAAKNRIVTDDGKCGREQQVLDCYDYFSQQGTTYRMIDYTPDLGRIGADNRSSSCFTGVWNLFADRDYNERNQNGAAYSAWGDRAFCLDLQGNPSFDNQASSVRFVGAPDGYTCDTINLYEYEFYMGLEQYSYGDVPSLNYDNLGRSAIVTGHEPWTLYEYNNYRGRCVCVYPSDMANGYPGFYKDLGAISNQVSSAKRGCYCNKKLAPEPVMTRSSTVGGSNYHPGN